LSLIIARVFKSRRMACMVDEEYTQILVGYLSGRNDFGVIGIDIG
jgi:hypothetical protein